MRRILYGLVASCVVSNTWAAPAYQGVSYTSFGNDVLSSPGSDQSLVNMSMLGTDTVALNFWWFQPDITSTNIAASGSSATIASIEHAIDHIHSLGMRVFLKPMLDVQDGTWRAEINPSDPDVWFANYRNYVGTFADLAEAKGVELFSVGCEFNTLENPANNQRWIDTIADIRTRYSGPVTYSANWNNGGIGGGYNAIEWWSELDSIGIDAYFPISTTTNPTQSQLTASWNTRADEIDAWRTANHPDKRVIFTEVGYSSYDGTTITPYDTSSQHPGVAADEVEQAAAYEALLSVMSQRDWWDGAFWWNWETNPNPTQSTSFTPQFKLAQEVLASHYGGQSTPLPVSEWTSNAGGQFGTAGNWTGGVPNAVFHVEFDRGAEASYTVAINNNSRTVQQLRFRSSSVTLDSSNATLRSLTADDFHMDDTNRGIIIGVDAGEVAVVNAGSAFSTLAGRGVTIGDAAGASGTLNLHNGANRLNVTGTDPSRIELIVGRAGSGTLSVSNGADVTVTAAGGNITVGKDAGSIGIVNLSGAGTSLSTNGIFRIGLNGQATLHVSSGASVSTTVLAIGNQGEVHYDGSLTGGISNSGSLHPGSSTGTLSVSGTYIQLSTGELFIEIASASSFDKLQISGSASLNGTLQVSLVDDYAPMLGEAFDILDFSTRIGSFAALNLPALASGLAWDSSLIYSTGVLNVVEGLHGDFNQDNVVDAADYAVWRNGLGTTYTMDDYDVWKSHFGETAGSGFGSAASPSSAVPEPAMPLLLLIGILTMLSRRCGTMS